MREFLNWIALWLFHLGGLSLLIVGIADSSFLVAPLANDLLVVALTAEHPQRMFFYAFMAAAGSTIGCFILDVVSRKAKESVEEKVSDGGHSSRRFRFVENRIRKHAGWTLAIAAVIPPPFPFTPFVAVAAGTGYPRKKLLAIAVGARFVRFAAEGGLAILFGAGILAWARTPAFECAVIALIVIAVCGSGYSLFRWIRKSRRSDGHGHK